MQSRLPKPFHPSAQSILEVRDCLKERERDQERRDMQEENDRKKLDTSNGRTRWGSWFSQSRENPNKVWKAKSRPPLEFRWMILRGPLSRSGFDGSMSNRCSFAMPFARIFSSLCFNRIRFLVFQFQIFLRGIKIFSFYIKSQKKSM